MTKERCHTEALEVRVGGWRIFNGGIIHTQGVNA
jgi:hypothetical protein